jgi:ATP/maltotriose-dependent transcriptional regulator MalT
MATRGCSSAGGRRLVTLLERNDELAALRDAVHDAAGRRGSVVLVAGEAGIGKSSLVRAWADDPGGDARVLVGYCDDFLTSRTLGPFHDIARVTGGALADAVGAADTSAVLDSLLADLDHPLRPTVLVLEDVHWADEATLDVVRYLGRRIAHLRAVLAVTFRDDEVGADHPLTGVLGVLPSAHVRRIRPHPLSPRAVAQLTVGTGLDPAEVLASTGGNPFFVSEVAQSTHGVPASVADAVLARLRSLPRASRDVIERLSVLPRAAGADELRSLVGGETDALALAEERGVLVVRDGTVGFRHELARQAVQSSLPVSTRRRHHEAVLDHLLEIDADPATILHHAVEASRADLVVRYGPAAAHEAYHAGAHRQALVHQRRVLRHADRLDPREHARLLEEHAWTHYNLHHFDGADEAAAQVLALEEQGGDVDRAVRAMTLRARMRYMTNHPDETGAILQQAEARLVGCRDPRTRAVVAVQRISLAHLLDQHDDAIAVADEVAPLLAELDDPELQVHATHYASASRVFRGEVEAGLTGMRDAIRIGREHGVVEPLARVYTNLVELLLVVRRWDEFRATADEAIAFYDDHDLPAHRYNTLGQVARLELSLGDWDRAERSLRSIVGSTADAGILAAISLEGLALLAVRRGHPDAGDLVARAWDVAVRTSAAPYIVPVACAGIELAWLEDDPTAAEPYVREGTEAIGQTTVLNGWLRWRLPLVGLPAEPEGVELEPERTSLRGDTAAAAERWGVLGMPYEQALELLRVGDEPALLQALALLGDLGAEPAARIARRRLRELGVRRIPRTPLSTTRANPAGLTARQVEVLALVAEGLTNAQIADRLVVSLRTVDHHVSAVLQKLGVSSRREAAERARTLQVP